jgi:ATP-dependent Clp protease protease subunit
MSEQNNNGSEIWVNGFEEADVKAFSQIINKQLNAVKDVNVPITVHIDSFGGSAYGLIAMIEILDSVHNPIITSCIGKAMSAGAILLSHGDARFCGPHSQIMIHEMSTCISHENVYDVANSAEHCIELNRYIMSLLARNCKIKGGYKGIRQIFKKRDSKDIFMTAKEAKEFGLVDEVGFPLIQPKEGFAILLSNKKRKK